MTMIHLTDLAATNLGQLMKRKCCTKGIQIGVDTYGCNGLTYTINGVYEEPESWNPVIFESNGIKIFVDPEHLPYLENLTLDWVTDGLNSRLEFINPNEVSRCGCGKSFQINPTK